MNWIDGEVAAVKLPDQRLKSRLHHLLSQLGKTPDESIPDNCSSWSDTLAAYRFFDNDKVTPQGILSGHVQATCRRIAQEPVVLMVQDTAFLSLVSEGDEVSEGGGLHHTETDTYCLHPTIAFTPQRVNLGSIGHAFWQRDDLSKTHRDQLPVEAKESARWLHSYEMACAVQARYPDTCVVSIADREGDIYQWLMKAQQQPTERKAEFIIRAKTDRRLGDDDDTATLFETLKTIRPLGAMQLMLSRTPTREARLVTLRLSAQQVTLRRPKRYKVKTPSVDVTAVYACEMAPPPGCKAVEWLLLTSLSVETISQAQTVLSWYTHRNPNLGGIDHNSYSQ